MALKEQIISKLVRPTFIGFVLSCLVIIIHPEVQNTIAILFTVLGGKNAVEHFKSIKKEEK